MADDSPEKRNDTHILWKQLKQGEYEIIVSPVVYEELGRCEDSLAKTLLEYLDELNIVNVDETTDTISLSQTYLDTGIMPQRTRDDCRHIAVASIYGCKYILSWNMKHFVKRRTIEMVRDVNRKLGVARPDIMTPRIFIEESEEND